MAGKTGADFCQRSVGEKSLPGYGPVTLMKRPVRIRTQGVVVRARETRPYPIRRLFAVVVFLIWQLSKLSPELL